MRKMKQQVLVVLVMCTVMSGTIFAATNYVVTPGTPGVTPTANYTSWATAATNIQDAIDVVGSGGVVLVTNGIYILTNEIMVVNSITVRSFNNGTTDRDGTILDGNYPITTNRCVNLDNTSAVLDGFTITNGYASIDSLTGDGGGIYLDQGTVTNCLVTGCEAGDDGGGVYVDGIATLTHSTISGNVATNGAGTGGGVYTWSVGGLVSDCQINFNKANTGGGVFMRGANTVLGSVLQNSTIANNTAFVYVSGQGSGGIGMQFRGTIDNCIIASNHVFKVVGTPYTGGVKLHDGGILLNSLVIDNMLEIGFGAGITANGKLCIASNCVIRGNQGGNGGGIHLGSTALVVDSSIVSNSSAAYCQGGTMRNCLVGYNDGYGLWSHTVKGSVWENCTVVGHQGVGMRFSQSNTVDSCIVYSNNNGGANWSYDGNTTASNSIWTSSCTTPELTGPNDTGNITNNPIFAAFAEGNYRLTSRSPCVNTGTNRDWMTGAVDRDGEPRLVGTTVDMGAYEFPPPLGTVIIVQ